MNYFGLCRGPCILLARRRRTAIQQDSRSGRGATDGFHLSDANPARAAASRAALRWYRAGMNNSNPLIDIDLPLPFDRIRPEHVEPAVAELLERARAGLAALGEAPPSFRLMEELDRLSEPLDRAMSAVRHLESVATSPELRAAYNAVEPLVSEFHSRLLLDEPLWKALNRYAQTDDARALTGPRRRFLTRTIDEFRRHGANLDPAGKSRLAGIDVELAALTTKFAEHVLDSTNEYELYIEREEGLAGLPAIARAAAREGAAAKGREGWRFTLHAPSITPVMMYLDDAAVRERMYRALVTRAVSGAHDNRPLIARILHLRREKAALLGYAHFADFALADRMAQNAARALDFVAGLRERTEARFRAENEELLDFARRDSGNPAAVLAPWDVAYYAEKLRAERYAFDQEELRPYFPVSRVVSGLFEIAARLFGVDIREESGPPVWDPSVKYYSIRNAAGSVIGGFYADWYPRENKRGGAWMDAFITGRRVEGGVTPHIGAICGNLTPPLEDKPALLAHREVETIFHEFGHLLHHCLSTVELRSQAGTNVAWDFVELPSQIMENWCWEREALDLFARHHATGEPVPIELFSRMRNARTFRAANAQMRQLGFAYSDLMLHTAYDPARDGDALAYSRRILQEFSPAPLPDEYAMIASFTHLFANPVGYAAGYYSYKWAEVLEADAFTRFRLEGIFNPATGAAFRDAILSRGDSDDPSRLYREFMGRDADVGALLERLGLLEPTAGDTGVE